MLNQVMSKEDGKSKGFGFVAFETTEAAEAAVQALNGKEMGEGKALYVARAQKKAERQQELKRKFEELKKSVTNLYSVLTCMLRIWMIPLMMIACVRSSPCMAPSHRPRLWPMRRDAPRVLVSFASFRPMKPLVPSLNSTDVSSAASHFM